VTRRSSKTFSAGGSDLCDLEISSTCVNLNSNYEIDKDQELKTLRILISCLWSELIESCSGKSPNR